MITADEKMVLLELARQVASLADGPQNEEKRELWLKHNTAHQTTMPSILLMNYFSYCVSPNLGLIFLDSIIASSDWPCRSSGMILSLSLYGSLAGMAKPTIASQR